MEINSTLFLPSVYLMTNIIVHTIASITIKIQRQRAVLMQANVSLMFSHGVRCYSRDNLKSLQINRAQI